MLRQLRPDYVHCFRLAGQLYPQRRPGRAGELVDKINGLSIQQLAIPPYTRSKQPLWPNRYPNRVAPTGDLISIPITRIPGKKTKKPPARWFPVPPWGYTVKGCNRYMPAENARKFAEDLGSTFVPVIIRVKPTHIVSYDYSKQGFIQTI